MVHSSKIVSLSEAKLNKIYYIKRFSKNISFYEKDRLFSYGFIEGNTIKLVRKSILGNTFQVKVSGSNLVIRKKEAKAILIQEKNYEN